MLVVWHFLRGLVRVIVATAVTAAAFDVLVLLGSLVHRGRRGTAVFRSASLLVSSPVEGRRRGCIGFLAIG